MNRLIKITTALFIAFSVSACDEKPKQSNVYVPVSDAQDKAGADGNQADTGTRAVKGR